MVGKLFALDLRSLGVFRIGLGFLLMLDLAKRSLTLRDHYTDVGAAPRELVLATFGDPSIFRLHFASGELWFQAVLFVFAALIATCLAVGYRTRIASLASLYLLTCVNLRNPLALHTGDGYLRVLVFWALFLPLGARFAIDRAEAQPNGERNQLTSVGTAAFWAQIVLFYVFAGLLKHQHEAWMRGDAVGIFLGIENYTTPIGSRVAEFPAIARMLTWGTLVLEGGLPFLFFSPFWTGPLRILLILALTGFHLGIWLCVHIGIFELTSIVALTALLPPWFWDRAVPWLRARLPLLDRSGWSVPGPSRLLERTRATVRLRPNALAEGTAAAALLVVVAYNLASLERATPPLPTAVQRVARLFAMNQNWSIFAAIDRVRWGWFGVIGELEGGTAMDVLQGGPFRGLERPDRPERTYVNHNERRFWFYMLFERFAPFRAHLARTLCDRWNDREARPIRRVAIFHVGRVEAEGKPPQPVLLINYECPGGQ